LKGPYGRLKIDVRRVWECPLCHRREWTGGEVVTLRCDCRAKNDPPAWAWMALIEEARGGRAEQTDEQPTAGDRSPDASGETNPTSS